MLDAQINSDSTDSYSEGIELEDSLKFRFCAALAELGIRKEKFCNLIKCYSVSTYLCCGRTRHTPGLRSTNSVKSIGSEEA